jgi:3-oxocholest-4-en-26-oyl-CoA dehydrogenase beta subunit
MDFSLSSETEAVRDLATRILTEQSTVDRLAELDAGDDWIDRRTYRELAEAGIVGIALPEDVGGAGLGFLELHYALEQVGATAAHVPLWETAVVAGLAISRHGTDEQRRRLLPGVASGETLLTGALAESGPSDARSPATVARRDDSGWRLDGAKTQVPLARSVDRILVSAGTDDGALGLFLLDPSAEGVTLEDQDTVSGKPHQLLRLEQALVADEDVLGEVDGSEMLHDVLLHAEAGLASVQSGVCAAALKLSATYTSEREQFGRPIASFQAVGQRVADAYIDTEAVRLAALQAAWRLAEGMDATEAVAIAKWWAAEAGHRVLHAAHHVHGGVGIDYEYPLHRYFMLGKQIEFVLGHGTQQLQRIGRVLADEPA